MNTAIIVAAGSGERFASATSKQFARILGRPLILHTLERFEACSAIDEIILVLTEEGCREFEQIEEGRAISKLKTIVAGGATRAESVRNGLDVVDAAKASIVAVHDGARPLVSVSEISQTVERAAETGAACLVAEVVDTIKQIDGGFVAGTVDRATLRRALTPQAFRYDLLRRALDGANLDASVTDECYLVEQLGVRIAFVEGSGRNIKVTRAEDIRLVEAWLSEA